MRPLIIVSPSVTDDLDEIKLSRACFRAVEAAGGLALAADYFRADELAERADEETSSLRSAEMSRTGNIGDLYALRGTDLSLSL